jgi:hypothetical protein
MNKKYQVKAIVPATIIRVFEVEATNEEEALALYLQGEAYETTKSTTSYYDDVEFKIEELDDTESNDGMFIDDDEWEREMGR